VLYNCFLVFGGLFQTLFSKKPKPKRRDRELTTVEATAWFSICISAMFIFVGSKGLFHHPAFLIPIGIIGVAIRSLYFSKELAALQTSKPASN
jgi:peptidoglycan/LPS O-acetylase OafA/YrhL